MDKLRCAARGITSALLVLTIAGCAASSTERPQPTATTAAAPSLSSIDPALNPSTDTRATQSSMPGPTNTRGLIDVGGYRLYIECQGRGSPTVVLDAGFSGFSGSWQRVAPRVATFTTVCAYDRANRGASDPGPVPATAERLVSDLEVLLERAQIPGPFVLVGQSFGGLIVRMYASRYPQEVAGLVLVDAVHEDYYGDGPGSFLLPRDGVINGVDLRRSGSEARTAAPLPDVPLLVLARAEPDLRFSTSANQRWPAWQLDLSKRAPRGRLIPIRNTSHDIQADQPDSVVDAVRQVVEARP